MYPNKSFRFLSCGIILLLIGIITILQLRTHFVSVSPLHRVPSVKDNGAVRPSLQVEVPIVKDNGTVRPSLQVLEPLQFANQNDVECVNASFDAVHFPMCIYDIKTDTGVSAGVASGGYDEVDLVRKWLGFCRKHPGVSFVDLGANLGLYSLPIAHAGIRVVSVEANKDTARRLAESVHLGHIEKNMDVLHYALSNEESTTFLKSAKSNPADTFMVGNGSCPGCLSVDVTVLNKLIPFVRSKKAVFKVDVQEAEIKVFQMECAAKFFNEIDVMLIQMEWILYPRNYGGTEDGRRRVDRFLEFFYQRGYDVYDPRSEKKLGADWKNWGVDVLFKKKELPKNQLFQI